MEEFQSRLPEPPPPRQRLVLQYCSKISDGTAKAGVRRSIPLALLNFRIITPTLPTRFAAVAFLLIGVFPVAKIDAGAETESRITVAVEGICGGGRREVA